MTYINYLSSRLLFYGDIVLTRLRILLRQEASLLTSGIYGWTLWSTRLLTSSVTVRWTVFWLREDAVLEFSQAVCFDKSLTIFVVHVTFQTLMFTQQVFLIPFFSAMSVWPLSHFTYWTELSLLDINRMLLRINAKTKFPLCHFTRLLKQSWPIRQDSAWFVAVIILTGGDRLEWSVEIKKNK